jgi:holliday junction DNA helicase RuvB
MLNRLKSSLQTERRAPEESAADLNSSRPETLNDFVGQGHLKQLIRTGVESSRKRNAAFPHCMVSGAAGLGKTSIAKLIAGEMGVRFIPVTADALEDTAQVKGLLSRLDDSGYDSKGQPVGPISPSILFLDEAHRLPRQSQELLYMCVEDRVLDAKVRDPLTGLVRPVREWVPHFTLIAATNHPGSLTASFRDRLRLHLRLEPYGDKDSATIAKAILRKFGVNCGSSSAKAIAARGRGVPRKIVGICEQIRDLAVSKGKVSASPALCVKAFDILGIDPMGLARLDVEYLMGLAAQGQPVGLKTAASMVSEAESSIEEAIEPYLLNTGLIARTSRGRVITPAGVEHLRQHHGLEERGRSLS